MNLLLVSQHFWPEEFRVNDLVPELQKRGFTVTVLTGFPNYPDGRVFSAFRAAPEAFSTFCGADVIRAPLIPRGRASGFNLAVNYLSFAFMAAAYGLFRLRRRRFDASLVFLSSPATQALPAFLLARLWGVPMYLWIQDLWPQSLAAVGAVRSPAALGLVGRAVQALYRAASGILIQSRAFTSDIRARAGEGVALHYLPNWSEPNVARGLENVQPAPELTQFVGDFKLLFAGNLGAAQDLEVVLHAAAECRDIPNLRWLFVGDGRARTEAEGLAAQLGLSDRVTFLGRHPAMRMPEFFKGADALLVSLRDDPVFALTIPSKVQTYLAAGRPIIGMLAGEGARVISESGGGLVAPAGDPRALADCVRKLVSMPPAARGQLAARGRAYAEAEFDKDMLLDRLAEVLRGAVDARRSGA